MLGFPVLDFRGLRLLGFQLCTPPSHIPNNRNNNYSHPSPKPHTLKPKPYIQRPSPKPEAFYKCQSRKPSCQPSCNRGVGISTLGGCQYSAPCLGPYYITAQCLGYPKRDHNFDNHPHGLFPQGSPMKFLVYSLPDTNPYGDPSRNFLVRLLKPLHGADI